MASELDVSLKAADIYAESLLDLANERGIADDIFSEFESLAEYIKSDAEFAGFLESTAVDDDDRRAALQQIFTGRINELLLNTLLVLNDHNRAGLVPLVFDRFKERYDAQMNRQDVRVSTAVPLDDAQRDAIRSALAAVTGKEIILQETVDEGLLGGLLVRIDDRQFDGTLRSKLATLRESVIRLGRQEILSGKHDFWTEG
jgi:F-type H+-transporting ATPase subunit delta